LQVPFESGLCGDKEAEGGEESKELAWREIGVQIDQPTEEAEKRSNLNRYLGSNLVREQLRQ